MNKRCLRKLFRQIVGITVLSTLVLLLSFTFSGNSRAIAAPGNQGMSQSARLVAPEPSTKITVYLRPEANKGKAGYGVDGDSVTVLEQVSDNQSTTWNHIRFDNPPYAEGWVPEKFISIKAMESQNQSQSQGQSQKQATVDRYLGNQSAQSNQRDSQQTNQQTNRQNSQNNYQSYSQSQRNQN